MSKPLPRINYTLYPGLEKHADMLVMFKADVRTLRASLLKKKIRFTRINVTFRKSTCGFYLSVQVLNKKKSVLSFGRLCRVSGPKAKRHLQHSHFFITRPINHGKGIAKDVFKISEHLVDHYHLTRIEVIAIGPVGGYAWLRYGFYPRDKEEVACITRTIRQKDVRKRLLTKKQINKWAALSHINKRAFVLTKEFRAYRHVVARSAWIGTADLTDPKIRSLIFSHKELRK